MVEIRKSKKREKKNGSQQSGRRMNHSVEFESPSLTLSLSLSFLPGPQQNGRR